MEIAIRLDPATRQIHITTAGIADVAHALLLLERVKSQLVAQPSPGLDGSGVQVPPPGLADRLAGGRGAGR